MNNQEIRAKEGEIGSMVEGELDKYRKRLLEVIELDLENFYGGPAKWPTGIHPKEEVEDILIAVFNQAVEMCINKLKEYR